MRKLLGLFFLCLIFLGCGKQKRSNHYEIGIDPSWYPLRLAGQERNILAFTIDLLSEIAKKENLELSIMQMNWNNLLWGLQEKKYPAAISSMNPYTFYIKKYQFSDPYLRTGPVLITPINSSIHSLKDIQGKEVAVVKGSSAALFLQTTPGVLISGFDTPVQAFEALQNEEVDAALIHILFAQNFIRNVYRDRFHIVTGPVNDHGLRLIALQNNHTNLLKRFDSGLYKLKESGNYARLLEKWGLSPDGKPLANLDEHVEIFLQSFF